MATSDQSLKEFFWTFARHFWERDYRAMARMHTIPLVVYSKVGPHVFRNQDDHVASLKLYRAAFDERDVTQLTPRIHTVEDLTPVRSRVSVEWLTDDEPEPTAMFYYMVREPQDDWKIEMIRIDRSPTPPEHVRKILQVEEDEI